MKRNNSNISDEFNKKYEDVKIPEEIDMAIERGIKRAKIRREKVNSFIVAACIAVFVIGGVTYEGFYKNSKIQNSPIKPRVVAQGESLPKVLSYSNLKKLCPDISVLKNYAFDGTTTKSPNIGYSKSDGYSTTNNQVAGVMESDIVQNDGRYIYKIDSYDRNVKIVEAYPVDQIKVLTTINFNDGFSPRELNLYKDTLSIIGDDLYKGSDGNSRQITKVIIYNIKDRSNPNLVKNVEMSGYYTTSRLIDKQLYIVTNEMLFVDDVKPFYKDSSKGEENRYIDYKDISYCPDNIYPNYLFIGAVDLENMKKEIKTTTILGNGNAIYCSAENLYIAGSQGNAGGPAAMKVPNSSSIANGASSESYIYKFNLKEGVATFIGKGKIKGYPLNQFSMDENAGYFRVAATEYNYDNNAGKMKSNLFIFDKDMKEVSSLKGLAPNEKIYSARFMGDRMYLVTFKNTDPLFVINLKDPLNPEVLGQLKIPGFSTYLHPYDENHIIGFGKDAEENAFGKTGVTISTGIKIALFDVTDVNNPKQMFSEVIGEMGSFSEALYNHKAFLFDREKNLMAFPVSVVTNKLLAFEGAYVYDISLDKGFVLKGKITHTKMETDENYDVTSNIYGKDKIDRLLYIGDNLYSISENNIMVNSLKDMKELKKIDMK